MRLSKKLFLIAATVLFCASSLCADVTIQIGKPSPKPAPARPAPAPAPSRAARPAPHRMDTIEGRVRVRGNKIYLDTDRDSFLIYVDYDNPRVSRRDFEHWDDMIVMVEGYIDYHYDEIEVIRVLKTPRDYLHHAKPAPAPARPAPAKPAPAKPAPAKPAPRPAL